MTKERIDQIRWYLEIGDDPEELLEKLLDELEEKAPEFPNQIPILTKIGRITKAYLFETDAESETELLEKIQSCVQAESEETEKVRLYQVANLDPLITRKYGFLFLSETETVVHHADKNLNRRKSG